ncbi:MAG: hypothetical protein R3D98_10330 [Candidatus Krumholzibacteriia bacterium]
MRPVPLMLFACALVLLGAAPVPAQEGPDAAMTSPARELNLLFIHNSCGGQLFADPGPIQGGESRATGEYCIHVSHPNGGGLRTRLEQAGYQVHEASYGSILGEHTDICQWRRKFAEHMDRVLRTRHQDELLPDGQRNQIVAFKSCYPNNVFRKGGQEPGDPDDCTRTVPNAKAAYRALLPMFHEHPDVLFVAFTAPPMTPYQPVGIKAKIKSWFTDTSRGGDLAIAFNAWLADREHGWLAGYDLPNVVVFDYYDILRAGNPDGYTSYPTRDGRDPHPSSEGNQLAADRFLPFLEAAVAPMSWSRP